MLAYIHITRTIAELLYKHNCVIVPGFGGYVARQQGALFSKSHTVLHPPSKSILFNKHLVHNDGLLASALAENTRCSFEEANLLLGDYVDYCKAMLQAKNRLELSQLGLFYLDAENTLRFEPEVDVNFLLDSFGLGPVLVHVAEEPEMTPPVVTPRTVFEDRRPATQPVAVPATKRKRNYARIASLAVGIPVALAMILFAGNSKTMKPVLESSLNPFYTAEKLYIPVKYTHMTPALNTEKLSALLTDANGYATFTLGSEGRVFVADMSNDTRTDNTAVKASQVKNLHSQGFAGKYQVVMGCFGIKENADRLITGLSRQNIHAAISGTNASGLLVVSAGGFNDKDAAEAMLSGIRSAYPNAWVMTR